MHLDILQEVGTDMIHGGQALIDNQFALDRQRLANRLPTS
jgi:hypothetical protein